MDEPDLATVQELFSGRYSVIERLPWNGLALVYRVDDPSGRPAAVAVLPIDGDSPEARARFEASTAPLEALSHERLVRVTGHGVQHDVPFLELDLAEGDTLGRALSGPLGTERSTRIACDILEAVAFAHERGVFHWDLTPQNVLLARDAIGVEFTRVLGIGVAPLLQKARSSEKTGPTGKGSGPRATHYLAPELTVHEPADARADVFSVGALLVHMLTGSIPPRTTDISAALGAIPDPELREAIARATQRRAADRFQTATEFRDVLLRQTKPHRSLPAPHSVPPIASVPPKKKSRAPLIAVAAIVLVILAAGGSALAYWIATSEPKQPIVRALPDAGPPPAPDAGLPDAGSAIVWTNRLTTGVPEGLATYAERVVNGEELSRDDVAALYEYARLHREDGLVHVVIAHAYMNRDWSSDAVERYVLAWETDPTLRAHRPMLDHLLGLLGREESGPLAMTAVVRIYGRDAIPVIDEQIAAEETRADMDRRLERLRERLLE
jgi:eukaryotic-like serine/threonine-protein kinase